MTSLDQLIRLLSKLPGVGKKSATRMAYYILDSEKTYAADIAECIQEVKRQIRPCSVCGGFTEQDPCSVCTDPVRDQSLVCVVETAQDMATMENARVFPGAYHVLGGVISPIDGVGPDNIRIAELIERVRTKAVREIVLATNPTVEGDTTALYIARQMEAFPDVSVTRLALGMPVGGDLEYVDRLTLERSLRGRTKL